MEDQPYENLAEGLDNLLSDAQAMADSHIGERHDKVRSSRQKLAAYRGELQCLFNEVKYTRECEVAVARQLMGQLPQPQIADGTPQDAPEIAPPAHRPSPDEYARVANELTRTEGLPRMLRRAS